MLGKESDFLKTFLIHQLLNALSCGELARGMLLLDAIGAPTLLNLGSFLAKLFELNVDAGGSRLSLDCCHLYPFNALQKCTP